MAAALAAVFAFAPGVATAACPTVGTSTAYGPEDTTGNRNKFFTTDTTITLGGPITGQGIGFRYDNSVVGAHPNLSVTNGVAISSSSDGLDVVSTEGDVCYDGLSTASIAVAGGNSTGGLNVLTSGAGNATATVAHDVTGAETGIMIATTDGHADLTVNAGSITGTTFAGSSYGISASTQNGSVTVSLNGGSSVADDYGLSLYGNDVTGTGLVVFVDSDVLVQGGYVGVEFLADSGTISLLGTGMSDTGKGIVGGAYGIGAYLFGDGTINLGTSTQRLGSVSGTFIGISATAGDSGAVNVFTGGAVVAGPSGYAISAGSSGAAITIDTAGDITGGVGIFVDLDSPTTGDILITTATGTTIDVRTGGAGGTGIWAIREDFPSTGAATGNLTIVNGATILAATGGSTVGISADVCNCTSGGLSITNRGAITADVGIWATASTLVNVQHLAGIIAATDTGILVGGLTTALDATVPVFVTVGSGATVVGDVGIGVDTGFGPPAANPASIVVAGTVTGTGGTAIDFASGAASNRLELQSGYVINGLVAGTSTADTLALGSSASGTFALPLIGTQFTGFDTFEKTGASTWTLTGTSAFAGPTTVLGGTLSLGTGASLPGSTLTVTSGTLAGNGTIGGLVAGGTVAPGNSIGTITVAGNASFLAGSTFAVEVDPTTSDRIAAGSATISGGTVNVTMLAGTYAASQQYTVLTTTGGRTGAFTGVGVSSAFYTATLSYDPLNAYVTLTRNAATFGTIGTTPNQKAVGTAIAGGGPYDTQMLVLGAGPARAALDGLSGEIHASLLGAFVESDQLRAAALDQSAAALATAPSVAPSAYAAGAASLPAGPTGGLWGRPYGAGGALLANGNAETLTWGEGGILAGTDTGAGPFALGAVVGLGMTRASVAPRNSTANSTDLSIGLYGGGGGDMGAIRFGAGYTHHLVSTTRTTGIPGVADTFSANYASGLAQLFAEANGTIDLGADELSPFAGAALMRQTRGAFTETGGAGALTVAASSYDALVTTLGLKVSHEFTIGDGKLVTATASAAWRHVAAGDPTITASFAGGQGFVVSGTAPGADSLLVSGGVALDLSPDWSLDLAYRGQFAPGAIGHSATATLAASF